MKKFTFKTDKPTGRYRSFFDPIYEIKYNKSVVGTISPKPPHRVRLMVSDLPDGHWRWVQLKYRGETLPETKAWLLENQEAIMEKYHLRQENQL